MDIEVVARPWVPEDRFVLTVGNLSLAGKEKFRKRVAAGEVAEHVLAELLVEEGKAVVG